MDELRRRWAIFAVALALALLFAIAAVGFVCGSIYLALVPVIGPPLAALAAAGAALVLALAIVLAGRVASRPRTVGTPFDGSRFATELGAELGAEAASLVSAHPRGTVLGCLLAGLAVGANPQLRHALQDVLARSNGAAGHRPPS